MHNQNARLFLLRNLLLLIAFLSTQQLYAQLSGTLTVNAGSPASATNFQTLNALASALSAQGISGNVTINVAANSGPYEEQVVFNTIPGAGPTATVTLNGNGNIVRSVTTTTDRHIIRLANISHFTVQNLKIEGVNTNANTQMMGLHVFGSGNNININNVEVDMTGITTSLTGGIILSGALSSILTAGNFSNITISNNTTTGGAYGISVFGTASSGIEIHSNTIFDFSSNAIYSRGTNGVVIRNNIINRRAGGALGTNGIQLAQSDNVNAVVHSNRISHELTSTATFRAIYIFGGSGHKVHNNLIHDIRAETGTAVHGIAVRAGTPEIYFNTIRLDHTVAGATNLFGISEELSNSGLQARNNIIVITQSTTGTRTGLAIASTTPVNGTVFSNRNVIFVPGGNVASRGTTVYGTLAAWQGAGTQDANSVSVDPLFQAGTSVPTNPVIDNQGEAITGITTDITGATRGTPPDPGAFEFSGTTCTGAVGGTATSTATADCAPGSITLNATGYSTGAGSTYQWEVSNDNFVNNISNLPGQDNPLSAIINNINSTAWYRLKVTCVAGTATSYSNVIMVTVQQPVSISSHPVSAAVCPGGSTIFNVTASNAVGYQWQKNGVDIPGATSSSYSIIDAGTADAGSYRVRVLSTAPCAEEISQAATLTINTPVAITADVQNVFACPGGNATFTVLATGSGITYQWQFGGTPISGATGASLTLTNITAANAGAYNVVVTGACNAVTSSIGNLVVGTANSWIGTASTDWHTAANWCGGVPTSASDITIPSGTPFSPVVTGTANVGSITVNSGASISIPATARLNVHGNYVNNGSLNAQGTIAFEGSASQTVGALTAGTVIVNGNGLVLNGNMSAENLVLTNGNIMLGNNSLSLGSTTSGSVNSHIITNGSGAVIASAVGTAAFTVPVATDAASYSPVVISNGGGLNYSVRVAEGINPPIASSARAINRTWTITPSATPGSNVTITLQYADALANASANPAGTMEVGVHNGTLWAIASPAGGINPSGTAAARTVTYQTTSFGPTVVANPGGINYPTSLPSPDVVISSAQLMPNLVQRSATLRVVTARKLEANISVTDATGREMQVARRELFHGVNDIPLDLSRFAPGIYHLRIQTQGHAPVVIRFVKE